MNRFKNHLLLAAGFAVLAGIIGGITAAPAIAQVIKAALIKNVDEPGRIPFQMRVLCGDAQSCFTPDITVPANKRLVIEFLGGNVHVAAGAKIIQVAPFLGTGAGSGVNGVYLHPEFVSTAAGYDNYAVNQPIALYVDPGSHISISAALTAPSSISFDGIIVGYMVDLGI